VLAVGCSTPDRPQPELRGVWLTNVDSNVLDRRSAIDSAMAFLAEHHFNAVFPVVWNDGYTLYPSAVADSVYGERIDPAYAGRDPLADVVDAAHAHGLAVIPWFEFGFASGYGPPNPGPILEARPSWAARDTSGAVLTKNGFRWLNPYRPDVRDFLAALVLEVARSYDVDGIQGDDRLPAHPVEGGYSEATRTLYAQQHDGRIPPAPRDSAFKRWRADVLNAFAGRIHREVKAVDSTLQVSWAPSVYPWSYDEYLQDWPAWVREGHADLVHPQVYRRDSARYRQTLERQRPDSIGLSPNAQPRLYPGVLIKVGEYRISSEHLLHAVRANRAEGYAGEVLFFYEGLREANDLLADTLRATVYRDRVPLPFDTTARN
jgi:uncharacterized lipoprotein YddW (UPF0748 family)